MSAILLSLLAGALTVVNPCVLPVLPIVLFGALQQHRLGPLALAGGMVAGFTALGLLVYGAGASLNLYADSVRQAGAVLMLLMGIVILSSPLKNRLAAAGSRWTGPLNALLDRASPSGPRGPRGFGGQFATGALLGAIWSPCSGPSSAKNLAWRLLPRWMTCVAAGGRLEREPAWHSLPVCVAMPGSTSDGGNS